MDIPPDLLEAQERGDALFVCGAGVSKRSGLHLFGELVEAIYRRLDEHWSHDPAEDAMMLARQYDRVLRCLERRLAASNVRRASGLHRRIRDAVRDELALPAGTPLPDHLALLELSRDAESRIRLLTTNFDTLFERASAGMRGRRIESHAGPAMPQPNSGRFEGVLHLHGRLSDPDLDLEGSELVLTSAEFGEAYLRSGWASRYVYDLSRAHTLVLVGYQADDPPMRYLLEVLEADRERYADLKPVYAFAPAGDGQDEAQRALWRAKGIEPILYRTPTAADHSALYDALRQWQVYAADPSTWREHRLRGLMAAPPGGLRPEQVQEAAGLLRHSDGARLLAAVSPDPAWLPVLGEREAVGPDRAGVGLWLETRLDDPDMIRAYAASPTLDDAGRRAVAWAVEHHPTLSPPHARAWRLLLRAHTGSAPEDGPGWYAVAGRVGRRDIDRDVRASVVAEFRPRLRVRPPFPGLETPADPAQDRLDGLIEVDFTVPENVAVQEVLAAWPTDASQELGLLRAADHALADALADADEAGYLDPLDRASHDVTSIARHDENALEGGFYPLVRLIADLWTRVSARDSVRARSMAAPWATSPYLLHKRLHLFALASPAFSPAEVAAVLGGLDDETVWFDDVRRELMHLLIARWPELDSSERTKLERRFRRGPPRSLAADPREDDTAWAAVSDYMVFRILGRLAGAGAALEPASTEALAAIRARHPDMERSTAGHDDAGARPEVMWGPFGNTERLLGVDDEQLVEVALRLQRTEFRESGVWGRLCVSDAGRAVRGVKLASGTDRWSPAVLVPLLSATGSNADPEVRDEIAALLLAVPPEALDGLRRAAASWLREGAEAWPPGSDDPPDMFFRVWDRLADATFVGVGHGADPPGDASLDRAFDSAGGDLAAAMLARVRARRPAEDSGFGPAVEARLTRIATTGQAEAVYGRLMLARDLAYLDYVASEWTAEHLVPRFDWSHPEAPFMWPAFAHRGTPGRPRLFNALEPALRDAFRRRELADRGARGLSRILLRVLVERQRAPASGYSIVAHDARAALAAGPAAVRQAASWQLVQVLKEGTRAEREEKWRTLIGPLFEAVWPLDAASRDGMSSRALAMMTLQCGALVPDAVGTVRDVLVPSAMHSMKLTLNMKSREGQALREHPRAFLHLLDALIGDDLAHVPADLAELLDACATADPAVGHDPAFDRLQGLRRRAQS